MAGRIEEKNHHQKQIQAFAFLAFLIGVLVLTYFIFKPFLTNIVLSAIVAILFRPLYNKFLKLFGGHQNLSALTVAIIALLAIAIPLALFIVVVSQEVVGTYRFISGYDVSGLYNRVQDWISEIFGASVQITAIDVGGYIRSALGFLLQNILGIFANITDFILQILIFILTLFYLLRDGRMLKEYLIKISPMSDMYDIEILQRLVVSVRSVIGGSIFTALIQGAVAIIGFGIFGVPSPVIWGSMAALASFIPSVGTSIITVPLIIYMMLSGAMGQAIGLLIWSAVVVGLIDNFVAPKLIGRGIKVNSLLVLLSIFGGVTFFGPLGFLFGPLVLSLFLALLGIYQKEFRDYVNGS